jgi:hypothetical protein
MTQPGRYSHRIPPFVDQKRRMETPEVIEPVLRSALTGTKPNPRFGDHFLKRMAQLVSRDWHGRVVGARKDPLIAVLALWGTGCTISLEKQAQ